MTRHQGRTSIKGTRVQEKKYKRTSYKYEFKYAVVKHYHLFGVDATIERFFASEGRDAARKRISKWNTNESMIASLVRNVRTAAHERLRPHGHSTALSLEAEDELVGWINELRRDGIPVSAAML